MHHQNFTSSFIQTDPYNYMIDAYFKLMFVWIMRMMLFFKYFKLSVLNIYDNRNVSFFTIFTISYDMWHELLYSKYSMNGKRLTFWRIKKINHNVDSNFLADIILFELKEWKKEAEKMSKKKKKIFILPILCATFCENMEKDNYVLDIFRPALWYHWRVFYLSCSAMCRDQQVKPTIKAY